MKIAVGSDERTHLTDMLVEELNKRGHKLILFGPLAENDLDLDWPLTSSKAAQAVASGKADEWNRQQIERVRQLEAGQALAE